MNHLIISSVILAENHRWLRTTVLTDLGRVNSALFCSDAVNRVMKEEQEADFIRLDSITFPTMTLVQKGSIALDNPAVTKPPGGQYAQHLTGVFGNLHQQNAPTSDSVCVSGKFYTD